MLLPVVLAFEIPGVLVPFPPGPPPTAFKLGLPVPAAPLPAALFEFGDPPPTKPAGGPPPTDPAGAPPPTPALPIPAAPTPPPSAAPPRLPPPATANPMGSAAISSAEAKLLGLQMIMTRSFQWIHRLCRSSDGVTIGIIILMRLVG